MKRFASVFRIPFGTIDVSKDFQKRCLSFLPWQDWRGASFSFYKN
jgi:hypothetical protein